jgi:hypothetical protein
MALKMQCSSAGIITYHKKPRLFHAVQVQPGGAEKCRTSQKQAQTQGVCCLPGLPSAAPAAIRAAASQKKGGQDTRSSRL